MDPLAQAAAQSAVRRLKTQAAIVALAFPLLALLRRLPRFVRAGLPAGSVGVGAAGLVWLFQRIPW